MKPIVNKLNDACAVILIPHLERQVHVFSDFREACYFVGTSYREPPCTTVARTYYNTTDGCQVALWFRDAEPYTIAHECLHAVNIIHDYVGFHPDRKNDEMDTYLLGYLVRGVYSAFRLLNNQRAVS